MKNFIESLKYKIIQQLYSFGDAELKYLIISEEGDLYKNKTYLYDFLKNLSLYKNMIENYDESKFDYLNYESIFKNSFLFRKYTYQKESKYSKYYCEDFEKEYFSLVLMGKNNKLYFFTFDIASLDLSEYFRYYYIHKRGILEDDVDTFLRFVRNFNHELYEIDLYLGNFITTSWNFDEIRNNMYYMQ